METSDISLRRLVSQTEAQTLLASFASLMPGQLAAVLDGDGKPVAHLGASALAEEWSVRVWTALQFRPVDEQADQPVCLEDAVCYPLFVDRQYLGWLVVENAAPVGAAMHSTLALLLKERVEKRRLARETLDRYREVNLLYRLTERFGVSLDTGEILQIALDEAKRVIRASSGIVWLTGMVSKPGDPPACFGPLAETRALEMLLRRLLPDDSNLTNANIATNVEDGEGVLATVMYSPLRVQGAFLGVLVLGKGAGQPEFTAGEQKLLQALVGQAVSAVEKAELHHQDLQHQRIAQELAIGQRIQRSLLPKNMPALPGWEFAASYQAANQVGGDFYDIFPLPGETDCQEVLRYGLTIADVSGKGIPAALMMAFSQGILHTAAFARTRPGDVLYQTNQSILQSSHSGLLLTAFYAVLDPCTGILTYANGGHESPVLYRAATADSQGLDCGRSLLLGALRGHSFREYEIQMAPGDLLLLYTDGVTEARDASGAFFAEERLYAVVSQYAGYGCSELLTALKEALTEFTVSEMQADDITLLALRRLS